MNRIRQEISRIWLWTGLVVTGYALEMFTDKLKGESDEQDTD